MRRVSFAARLEWQSRPLPLDAGAPIWIVPVRPDSNWAERAPALAGFPGYTEEQGEKILEQAIGPNGLPLRQPMHQYHLKHEDAVAIIAYLKTLRGGSSPQ